MTLEVKILTIELLDMGAVREDCFNDSPSEAVRQLQPGPLGVEFHFNDVRCEVVRRVSTVQGITKV